MVACHGRFVSGRAFTLAIPFIPSGFAAAQTTALYFDSQPRESIGQGLQQMRTPSATTRFGVWNNGQNTVHVDRVGFWWNLTVTAPTGITLSNGMCEYATGITFGAAVGTWR